MCNSPFRSVLRVRIAQCGTPTLNDEFLQVLACCTGIPFLTSQMHICVTISIGFTRAFTLTEYAFGNVGNTFGATVEAVGIVAAAAVVAVVAASAAAVGISVLGSTVNDAIEGRKVRPSKKHKLIVQWRNGGMKKDGLVD